MKTIAVIMAAGQGTRMHSELPKVLHPLLGNPMVQYVVQAATEATQEKPVMILGHQAERIRPQFADQAEIVLQEPQLGTGHAIQQVESILSGRSDSVMVLPADIPLIRIETLQKLIDFHYSHAQPLSLLTLRTRESRGFGRILRDPQGMGTVQAIIEEAVANQEQLSINEFNVGMYCFRQNWLWDALKQIQISPKGEFYLTDLVSIAYQEGLPAKNLTVDQEEEFIGINNRIHLSQAEAVLRRRINEQWMLSGVTMIDPASTYIEPGVKIGQDTVLWPNTYLQGDTQIGQGCEIGPNAIVRNTRIGDRCKVIASVLESAVLENHVDIGPFGHLRKGAHLAEGVHMGNFGEVKNSYLSAGVKMGHFSYIGDAHVGPEVNIGAGTITCNFGLDGKKNKTEIGQGAFIGSDTLLIAPVRIGEGAATGSGAVVTKDVPDHTLAVGMPARVIRKLEK